MAQFTCPHCGDGFEQKSRYERHLATAHPPSALTAADVEKALAGIQLPQQKAELVSFAGRTHPPDSAVMDAIMSLPERVYRDAADVAVAFGELKAAGRIRSAEEVAATEPPGQRGGRAASRSATSPIAVAKVVGG